MVGSGTGKMDEYPLRESLGAEGGFNKGAYNESLDGN